MVPLESFLDQMTVVTARLSTWRANLPGRTLIISDASLPARGCSFNHGELNFLFYRIDAIHEHAYPLPQAVDLAVALADDLAGVFVVGVAVVG